MKKLFFISAMLIGNIAYSSPYVSCSEVSVSCSYRSKKILLEMTYYTVNKESCDYKNLTLTYMDLSNPTRGISGRYIRDNGCGRDLLLERFISSPKGSEIVSEMKTRLDSVVKKRELRTKSEVYRVDLF